MRMPRASAFSLQSRRVCNTCFRLTTPLRLAGRVHLVVPRRFKTEALNNETPSEGHHGAKPLDSRLSAKKLRSYGEAIAGFIGAQRLLPPPPSPLNCLLLLLALSQEPGACV